MQAAANTNCYSDLILPKDFIQQQHIACTARPPRESDRTHRTRPCKTRTLTYLVHSSDAYTCHNPRHQVACLFTPHAFLV